jgi:hypothetical protein
MLASIDVLTHVDLVPNSGEDFGDPALSSRDDPDLASSHFGDPSSIKQR